MQQFVQKKVVAISTPKLLVLVSMYPIYNDMADFLAKIRKTMLNKTL